MKGITFCLLLCYVSVCTIAEWSAFSMLPPPEKLTNIDYTAAPYIIHLECRGQHINYSSYGALITPEYVLTSEEGSFISKSCNSSIYFVAGTYEAYDSRSFSGQTRHYSKMHILPTKPRKDEFERIVIFKMGEPFDLTDTVNLVNFPPTKGYISRPECGHIRQIHMREGPVEALTLEGPLLGLSYAMEELTTNWCSYCRGKPWVVCYKVIKNKQSNCIGQDGMPALCNGFIVAISKRREYYSVCYRLDIADDPELCKVLNVVEYYYSDIENVTGRKMPTNAENTKNYANNNTKSFSIFMVRVILALCLFQIIN